MKKRFFFRINNLLKGLLTWAIVPILLAFATSANAQSTLTFLAGTGERLLPFSQTVTLPKFNRTYARLLSTGLVGAVRSSQNGFITNPTNIIQFPTLFTRVSGIFRYSDGVEFLSASPSDDTTITLVPGATGFINSSTIANPTKTLSSAEQNARWVGSGNVSINVTETILNSFVTPGGLIVNLDPMTGEMSLRVTYTYQDIGLTQADPIQEFVGDGSGRLFSGLPSGRYISLGGGSDFLLSTNSAFSALTLPVGLGDQFEMFDLQGNQVGTASAGERFVLGTALAGLRVEGFTGDNAILKLETLNGTSNVLAAPAPVPEPVTAGTMLIGVISLVCRRRRDSR